MGERATISFQNGDIVEMRQLGISPTQSERLSRLLVEFKVAPSRSEAERLLKQGGVEINGRRVEDVKFEIDLSKPGEFLVRAGKKKFLRIVVE